MGEKLRKIRVFLDDINGKHIEITNEDNDHQLLRYQAHCSLKIHSNPNLLYLDIEAVI
jgi:hypothetical protein